MTEGRNLNFILRRDQWRNFLWASRLCGGKQQFSIARTKLPRLVIAGGNGEYMTMYLTTSEHYSLLSTSLICLDLHVWYVMSYCPLPISFFLQIVKDIRSKFFCVWFFWLFHLLFQVLYATWWFCLQRIVYSSQIGILFVARHGILWNSFCRTLFGSHMKFIVMLK